MVATALPFRSSTVPFSEVAAHWPIIANLLLGSLAGAWLGAGWATRLSSAVLYRVLAVLLVMIAGVLLVGHDVAASGTMVTGTAQMMAGVLAEFGIGVVASLMSVAGGELLIPTLVLLFGADIKLAESLSLAFSLPTMLVGFAHYSRDQSFTVLARNGRFVCGHGGRLDPWRLHRRPASGIVPNEILLPALAAILLVSAVKVWRHK